MANHTGSEGHLAIGANTIAELKSWSLSVSASTIDDTELSDSWMTKKAGLNSWSGGCEAYWDETDTNGQEALTIGTSVTGNFHPEGATGTLYSGTMLVTSIERSASVDGMVEVAFSFEGTGTLTQSTV